MEHTTHTLNLFIHVYMYLSMYVSMQIYFYDLLLQHMQVPTYAFLSSK